jgi:hypothetical protein
MLKKGHFYDWYKYWENKKKTKSFMELTEIIRTTLIFFTLLSSVYFAISYGIYKYRDRKRVKPYLKNPDLDSSVVLLKADEEIKPVQIQKQQIKRFHILNDNIKIHSIPAFSETQPVHKLRQKPVISYYSFNKNEQLRKLQTLPYTD